MMTDSRGGKMKNPILKKLYTEEELHCKIEQHMARYKRWQSKNDYRLMAFECYDIARFFELLEDKERSDYYYQEIVDGWKAYPGEVFDHLCVSALKALNRPEEALEVVLEHPERWSPITLAGIYNKLGRTREAQLIYAGLSYYSYRTSEVRHLFWRPHYLQEAADLCEKGQDFRNVHMYNQKAVAAWEEAKNNMQEQIKLIEEAWLYEEVAYIYEKAAVFVHQIDGDWDKYYGFFAYQIPDFRLIFFRSDIPEKNDCRRMKYRFLNLEEQMKSI